MTNKTGLVNEHDMLAEQVNQGCCFKDEWQKGIFKGFVGRGNFVLDFVWDNDVLKQVKLLSRKGGVCKVK